MTKDENYIYQERLALLGVIDREVGVIEQAIALADVERFRDESNPDPQRTFKL